MTRKDMAKTGYHWKQVDAGIMAPLHDRPGIAWSADYPEMREAARHRPRFGQWVLVRNRDDAIADHDSLRDFIDGQASARDVEWL